MIMRFISPIRSRSAALSVLFAVAALGIMALPAQAQEMIIGQETIEPGIALTFEGAPKDDVTPYEQNLAEAKTDVHIEVLTNWATDPDVDVPEGVTRGGFVGFLHFYATITNEETGRTENVELIPHVTLGDAMHYARNVSLPGEADDPYTVRFDARPPNETELAFHKSWRDAHGSPLFQPVSFTYKSLDFAAVAAATRR